MPALHIRDDNLLEQRQERSPLSGIEIPEEALDGGRSGRRNARSPPGPLCGELE